MPGSPTLKRILLSGFLVAMIAAQACGGARPYSLMYQASQSELSASAQARDHRLKTHLRAALVGEQGFAGLTLSPDVFMERGYVIGRVDTPDQAEAVLRVARGVQGLRSVNGYLPVTRSGDGNDSSLVSDVTIQAEIASALRLASGVVASRISVTVLNGHVVLLGVVSGEEERRRAAEAVSGIEGVRGVTNWLLLPESDYMAVRPKFR